jgi:hypothetical protein
VKKLVDASQDSDYTQRMHIVAAADRLAAKLPELQTLADAYRASENNSAEEAAILERLAALVVLTVERFDFGSADRLGRAIGATITTADAGGLWVAQAQPTRNGKDYQASGEIMTFESLAARDAWREKYLKGARKRAEDRRGK